MKGWGMGLCVSWFGLTVMGLPQSAGVSTANEVTTLTATPGTVAWGYYSGRAKPVLTVHTGDTVVMQTLSTCGSPEDQERFGCRRRRFRRIRGRSTRR